MISLSVSFISCATKEDIETDNSERFKVLEANQYDDRISGAKHSTEIELSNETYEKSDIEKSKTLTVNNENFEATYSYSKKSYLYHGDFDRYESKNGENITMIDINSYSGKCDGYFFLDKKYLNEVNEKNKSELTKEECSDIAKQYFEEFAGYEDSCNHILVNEKYIDSPEWKGYYLFEFARVIDGIKTWDRAYIYVTVFGDVIGHYFMSFGSMKDAKLPSESDMKTIEENVEKKLQDIYDNVSDKYSISYEIPKPTFIRMHDGRYALDYSVEVELTLKEGDDARLFSELTQLIVYVD